MLRHNQEICMTRLYDQFTVEQKQQYERAKADYLASIKRNDVDGDRVLKYSDVEQFTYMNGLDRNSQAFKKLCGNPNLFSNAIHIANYGIEVNFTRRLDDDGVKAKAVRDGKDIAEVAAARDAYQQYLTNVDMESFRKGFENLGSDFQNFKQNCPQTTRPKGPAI
jgi:hypothetical protein